MWRKEKKNSIEKGINAKSGELLIGVIKIMMLIIENNLHVEGYYYLLSYAISVFSHDSTGFIVYNRKYFTLIR